MKKEREIFVFILLKDNFLLRNQHGEYQMYLKKGDLLFTNYEDRLGDMIFRVNDHNVSYRQLQIKDMITGGIYMPGEKTCNHSHPDFNPNKKCYCGFHQDVLKDVTISYRREKALSNILD